MEETVESDGLLNLSRALELPPIPSHEKLPKEAVRCGGGAPGGGGSRRNHSTTSLTRTLSASSVLSKVPRSQQQQRTPSSALSMGSTSNNNNSIDLHKMTSLDEINQNPQYIGRSSASVFSSSTSSSSRNNITLDYPAQRSSNLDNNDPDNSSYTSPTDESFVVTYKPDQMSIHSSRYYEKMATKPWVPTYNKKPSQSQLPQISTSAGLPLETPPQSPEMASIGSGGNHSKVRTSSFHSSNNTIEQRIKLARSKSSSWSNPLKFGPNADTTTTNNQSSSSQGSSSAYNQGINDDKGGSGASVTKTYNIHEDYESRRWEDAVPPLSLYEHVPRMFGEEPPKISGHTCTLIREKLYIFGGKTDNSVSNSLYVFNCITHTLSKPKLNGTVPPPIYDMTATKVGAKSIYFFGGQDENKVCNNDLYVLNIATFTFTKLKLEGRVPPARRGHSTVHYLNTLYLFGGFSNDQPVNDVWKIELGSAPLEGTVTCSEVLSLEKDTAHWPSERGYHTAHYAPPKSALEDGVNAMMVVYGGNSLTEVFDEVWFFDFYVEKWQWLGPTKIKCDPNEPPDQATAQVPRPPNTPPHPMCCRTLHSSELSGKYLITYGGHNGSTFMNTLDVLNLQTRRWTVRTCYGFKNPGPCSHSGAIYDSRYYVIGGFDLNQILTGIKVIEMPLFPVFQPQ